MRPNLAIWKPDLDFEDHKRGFLRVLGRLYGLIFRCPRGKHRRSSSHIRKAGDQYTSRCRSCRKPMVRLSKRNWALDDRRA
jgi:transcription elongation factor Elf1